MSLANVIHGTNPADPWPLGGNVWAEFGFRGFESGNSEIDGLYFYCTEYMHSVYVRVGEFCCGVGVMEIYYVGIWERNRAENGLHVLCGLCIITGHYNAMRQ